MIDIKKILSEMKIAPRMVCTLDMFNTVDLLYGIQTEGGYKVLLASA